MKAFKQLSTALLLVWILWTQVSTSQGDTWTPEHEFPTQTDCLDYAKDWVDHILQEHKDAKATGPYGFSIFGGKARAEFLCFPDTFDPRGKQL